MFSFDLEGDCFQLPGMNQEEGEKCKAEHNPLGWLVGFIFHNHSRICSERILSDRHRLIGLITED